MKNDVPTKILDFNFNLKDDLYCVKDNVYILIPIPMCMNCQFWDNFTIIIDVFSVDEYYRTQHDNIYIKSGQIIQNKCPLKLN